MAGKVSVKTDTPKIDAYKVSGKTLAEIWKSIEKNGPKDGGKSRAGFTSAPVNTPNSYKYDEVEDKSGKVKVKAGEVVWKVKVKGGELKVTPTIKIPSLSSTDDLSDKAKKAWESFMKDLRAHEDEHVAATKGEAEAIAKEIDEIEGIGTGKDQKSAVKAAEKDWGEKFKAAFDGGKLQKRLKKVNEDLDTGGHGPVLDTSIE